MSRLFDIDNFNILADEENYYFFRALNMADNKDIETSVITDSSGKVQRVRTDRERYEGTSKYSEDDNISLQEIFDHCKMHHRTDTNCISLTSNANVALMYGRGYYKDKYVMIKVPKSEVGKTVINAGQYMMDEIQDAISSYNKQGKLDDLEKYYLDSIEYARTQEQLDRVVEMSKQRLNRKDTSEIFQKGIIYNNENTTSVDYSALNSEQNFQKNKMIAKLNILNDNILKNVSNKFLIQTLGNVFSSLELIHYKDINGEKIIDVSKEIIDIFALLQQAPENDNLVNELKKEIIDYAVKGNASFDKFEFENYEIPENQYTIEKMYELTNGTVNFYDSITAYKKLFYLSKSKLRAEYTADLISNITNNNPKYRELTNYLINNTYGVEPEIFSRQSSNKMKISEAVSLDLRSKEKPIFDHIINLSRESLISHLNNPYDLLEKYLENYAQEQQDKKSYYINALIDLFDWSKLGVVGFSDGRQRDQLFNKMKEYDVISIYNLLKQYNIKEKDIANTLLTAVVKGKDISQEINTNDTFTVEQLEEFLDYYKINNTKGLKLRNYQSYTLKNIDKIFEEKQFASAVLPTGAGKSFVALAEMLEHKDEEILYLAPNDEILNQIKKYILNIICDEDIRKTDEEKIKEAFPKLTLCTYQSLLQDKKNGVLNDWNRICDKKYDLVVIDELHRTGAAEWMPAIDELFSNQDDKIKVLGITATPVRDMDSKNMTEEWAKYFGYTEQEIYQHKHLAMNMDLMEGIRSRYVINSKVVNCEYMLSENGGLLDNLLEKIDEVMDEKEKNTLLTKYNDLRRRVEEADGVGKILKDNVQKGKKYIVFCPVVNNSGKQLESEHGYSEDYRLSGKEVIEKYIEELKTHLSDEFDLEFHSMLGEYSKSKNRRELEKFEKNDPEKVKLMVVMNKLNEGVHVKDVDGIIWYRPLDENSYILFHQQFGRIIRGLAPGEEVSKEDWPTVIDLVNNTLRVNLEKHAKIETSDLDKLVLINSWIEEHDYKIPDINSNDRLESRYASTLKKIQGKYDKFVENNELLEEKSLKEKSEISAIIELGNNFDLWNIDFPVKLKRENEKQDINDITSFELTGILRDFCDLSEEVDEKLSISREKKKEEFIKTIHELGRLPKTSINNGGESERVFADGTDQRNYFQHLQSIYKKIDRNSELTETQKQTIRDYEEIKEVLNQYIVTLSSEEKKEELIKTIHKFRRLPKIPSNNGCESERVFADGTDQRNYFQHLQRAYKKINRNSELTETQKQTIRDYEEIKEVLDQYIVTISSEKKKEEFIKTIHELGGLPKNPNNNGGESERVFVDGTDQRIYFDKLQNAYNKIDRNSELTEKQKQTIRDYEEIKEVLNQYIVTVSSEEKKEELIKTIHKLRRLPKIPSNNGCESERVFADGTDQRNYFQNLQIAYKKINRNSELTEKQKQTIRDYEEIKEVLNQYIVTISSEEKKEELIKTIHKLGRLPNKKRGTENESERVFADGTDQRYYFDGLQKAYKKIDRNSELTEKQKQTIRDYEEIKEVLDQYIVTLSSEEKKEEFIKTIYELGGLPKNPNNNGGESERVFADGTDQRYYFQHLQSAYNKIDRNSELTDLEKQTIRDYEEIKEVLNQYIVTLSSEEKKEELIKTIHKLGGLPKQKRGTGNEPERVFADGTDQRSYFQHLQSAYNKIDRNSELTENQKQTIRDYEEIMQVKMEVENNIENQSQEREFAKIFDDVSDEPKSEKITTELDEMFNTENKPTSGKSKK